MMHMLLLWLTNFIQIVLIGYQTKNITNNKYLAAVISQFIIGVVQVVFVSVVVAMPVIPACLVMGSSGAVGIIVGMWLFQKI